jgi:3alpha(or 20beta)-hydroxysteroid dehydrogenase
VVVTGGAAGQGREEVDSFVREGAHVVLVDVNAEAAELTADDCPDRVRAVVADVSDPAGWQSALAAVGDWRPPTVLVNNAAVHWARPIEDERAEDVLRMLRINLLGPLLGIQALTPVMREAGGGSIVNISSTAGATGIPYMAAYSASKWGLRGLTKVAALELASAGIRVNSVHPGPIDTAMMRRSPTYQADPAVRHAHIAMRRPGLVSEVAAVVLFLASDDSSFMTGAELAVDGGMLAGRPPASDWARLATAASEEAARAGD